MLAHSSAARAASSPARKEPLPDINDRLAPPETRIEVLDGKKIVTMPADPEHATKHGKVTVVVGAHVAKGYELAVDMLTRTSKTSDFAPDVSIFPSAPDPRTKGRQLEELAFEVASKQALKVPTDKARKLVARGVRRVFCVLVKKGRLLEWSPAVDGWATVPATSSIHDRCLVRPLPVAALLDAARADDEVAEALLVKRPPAIRRALSESKAEGHVEGKVEGRREGEEKGRREGEEKGRREGEEKGRREGEEKGRREGEEKGRREGEEKGHVEGKAEGRRQGKAEGRTEGKAEAVLAVLDARGIKVPSALRKRILAPTDAGEVDQWLRRAAVVQKARELFGERP
jgi:Putative restriction endonuclease